MPSWQPIMASTLWGTLILAWSFLCRQLPQVRHHCRLICWRQPNARLLRVSFSCSRPVRTLKQYAHIIIVAMAAAIAIRSHRNCGDGCSDRTANWATESSEPVRGMARSKARSSISVCLYVAFCFCLYCTVQHICLRRTVPV